jgi:hypothetical protein
MKVRDAVDILNDIDDVNESFMRGLGPTGVEVFTVDKMTVDKIIKLLTDYEAIIMNAEIVKKL